MASRRLATRSHTTLALVLRRTPYGDSDLISSLFTEKLGRVSALARAARKSQRRFGGGLEPFHTLEVDLDQSSGSDLASLRAARVIQPRTRLLGHLAGMEAAGVFLGWLRHSAPEHTPEPVLWELAIACLDELERADVAPGATSKARLALATHGWRLLVACGWRLELERCVVSGARCPDEKSALIDPVRGGLVSRAQGGAGILVSGSTRQRLLATGRGQADVLEAADAEVVIELVERTLQAHAGLSR
jgi:DNA repair protein RecO (recombination protein O)